MDKPSTCHLWHWCTGGVLEDVALVWANCRTFNAADPDLLRVCNAAEVELVHRWAAAGLPTGRTESGRRCAAFRLVM